MSGSSKPTFHVIAEWQIMGESYDGGKIDGRYYVENLLSDGIGLGRIESYRVIHVADGIWGLQFIIFEADLKLTMRSKLKYLKRAAENRLNKVVHDTDVKVRLLTRVA